MPGDHPTPPPPPPPAGATLPNPQYGRPQREPRSKWFWIAILGGCFVVLIIVALIVAAVAIPQLLKVRKSANQVSAIQTVRAISSAETNYALTYPANGFACSLAALGGDPNSGPPTAQAAQLIDPALAASGVKAGYTFAITCSTKAPTNGQNTYTSYQLTAIPETVSKTGDNGYCSDENDVIKVDRAGNANCTEPLQ
jgi:type IV pilus assembly protein PilA